MPRVLLSGVVLGQPMGGVRRHSAELLPRAARLLREGGGRLEILEGRVPIEFELPPDVKRHASGVPHGPAWKRALFEGQALERCLRSSRRSGEPFDLVHTAHLPVPRALGRPDGVPLALTLHDLRSLDPLLSGPIRRRVARRVLASAIDRARLVIAVSETVAQALRRLFEPRRLVVVPNAADHLEVLPRSAQPGAEEPKLLHVGHLEPRKNLGLLLHALALAPDLPALQFAGRAKGREEERLSALARELGVLERVLFLGPVEDDELARLYARAACAVFPSHLEGFGIGALEAQRAGVPVAVADAGALREVVGSAVPCFGTSDPRAAAQAIRAALASDPSTLARHAKRADEFRWERSARRLVDAWREASD